MKVEFVIKAQSKTLVLLFTGWSTDYRLWENMQLNCDFAVVYDYRDLQLDSSLFKDYTSIYVFAWSFGVFAASRFIGNNNELPIVLKMAINGTQFPIDDKKGIPERIFKGTMDNLSMRNLEKFQKRICSDSSQFEKLSINNELLNISDLKDELSKIEQLSAIKANTIIWDEAILSSDDKIFPYQNQIEGWKHLANNISEIKASHFPPNLMEIITEKVINKPLLQKRFSKALSKYNQEAVFQKEIAKTLLNLWETYTPFEKNKSILEIGCGSGYFTNLYATKLNPKRLLLNDICNVPSEYFKFDIDYSFIQSDGEELDFISEQDKFDYIVSASTIQWFENIREFLHKLSKHLNKNGYIVISTFGRNNMQEIRDITNRTLNYQSIESLTSLLKTDYEIIYLKEFNDKLYFNSPLEIIKHFKATGVNSISNKKPWTRSDFDTFTKMYPKEENGYPLTYHSIYIIAKLKDYNE